jgi:outer membrane receptor protein involved in Fe transport
MVSAGATEPDGQAIDEIQVTATRRPAAVTDVSAALTLIDAEKIKGARLVTDALAAEPGVFLQQTTPGQGAAIVRGLKGSEVLHIVDGFRLNNAIFRNAPTQYMALVTPGSVQRIEVLRGAPASLYGSDAVGGVVQLVSRMPSLAAAGSRREVFLSYDTADLGKLMRASYDVGNEQLSALVSGEYLDTGNRKPGGGGRIAPSGYEANGARFALQATPTDDLAWSFDFQFASQPATPRTDELVPGFGQTEPSSSEFLFAPNERTFAHLRHRRDDWLWSADWNFAVGWQQVVDDRTTRDFASTERRYEQNSSDLLGLTISAAGDMTRGSWIAGLEIYSDEVRSRRSEVDITSGQGQELAARFPDKSTVEQAAVYGNLQHYLGERHRLSAGLRFSAIKVRIPDTGSVQAAAIDDDDVSADLGWIYDLTDYTQLVANLGFGFRAPNVFDLGTLGDRPGNRFNIPNPDLQAEKITQFDMGLRHGSERWNADFTLFTLHYTDRIISELTGDLTPSGREIVQSRNIAAADIYGVEARAHYLLSASLEADLVLNYQRGDQEASGTTDPADRMPPFNGRLGLLYDAAESWTLEPYLVFAGRQDRLSERDVHDTRIDPNGTPGWITVNVATSWQLNEQWQLRMTLENIFDENYRMHGSGIDAVGRNFIISANALW